MGKNPYLPTSQSCSEDYETVRDSQNHGDNWGLLSLAAHVRGENTRLRGSSLPAPSLKVIKDVVNGKSGPSFSPPQMFLYYSVLPVMIDMKACL